MAKLMIEHNIRPLFIFALPRSGSTLLQRILSNHPSIHTVSEPWLLLPLFELFNSEGTFTEYSHLNTSRALNDLYQNLPNNKEDIYIEIRNFVLNIYNKICLNQKNTATYFLDKTPRYHYYIDHIYHTFPEAKFIYIIRNPLAIIASMINTDHSKNWNLYFYNIDLYKGLENLIKYHGKYSSSSIIINFEDLIKFPDIQIKKIYEYLEVENPAQNVCLESSKYLSGQMGDQLDVSKQKQLNREAIDKWKDVINNPIRKIWCRKYVRWVGEDRLEAMGYDMTSILQSLSECNVSIDRQMFKDLYRIVFGMFYSTFEYTIVKHNLKRFPNLSRICAKT